MSGFVDLPVQILQISQISGVQIFDYLGVDVGKVAEFGDDARQQNDNQISRIGLNAGVFHWRDLIVRRGQAHDTFAVKLATLVPIAARQAEWKFGDHHAFIHPSCVISSVSMATSLLVAFRLGPVHLLGHPLMKFQRSFSSPDSFIRIIEPETRFVFPSITVLRQSHRQASSVAPHLRVMAEYLTRPGSLRAVYALSVPSR